MKERCSIFSCGKAAVSRGWCNPHWHRWKRYGDPMGGPPMPWRFLHETALVYNGDECLPWPFSTNEKGYGRFRKGGKIFRVNRFICTSINGAPPTQKHEAAHRCGNRLCCNPKHIEWLTKAENERDRVVHGTSNRGERNAKVKLTEQEVHQIRTLNRRFSRREIGEVYGVAPTTISAIIDGKNWAWLE